jgi:hypothetical protein
MKNLFQTSPEHDSPDLPAAEENVLQVTAQFTDLIVTGCGTAGWDHTVWSPMPKAYLHF